jgi:ribonuclease HI
MVDVYTDGSCLGNPGPGGWACALYGVFEEKGGDPATTNNRMELFAVQRALEECLKRSICDVTIWTDSAYVKNGITKWIHGWKKNGWKTASGGEVKNRDCWERIDALREKTPGVEWRWVKAHDKKRGHAMNDKVDRLARDMATCYKNNAPPQ